MCLRLRKASSGRSEKIPTTTAPAIAARAAPIECVASWTLDPTYRQPSGSPTQSTRLPMNMIASISAALDPARIALRTALKLPEAEAAGAALERLPKQPGGGDADQPADRDHQRAGHIALPAQDEDDGHRCEGGGAGKKRRVRAVAGEVLPDRQLEAGERSQHQRANEHDPAARTADDEAERQGDEREQHHQRHERELPPGGGRALVDRGAPAPARRGRLPAAARTATPPPLARRRAPPAARGHLPVESRPREGRAEQRAELSLELRNLFPEGAPRRGLVRRDERADRNGACQDREVRPLFDHLRHRSLLASMRSPDGTTAMAHFRQARLPLRLPPGAPPRRSTAPPPRSRPALP